MVLVALSRHAGDLTRTERSVFEAFNTLPSGLRSLFRLVYALGALWTLGLVVLAALVGRRWRLARDMALAGIVSWGVARLMGALVVDSSAIASSFHTIVRVGHDTPKFPVPRLALVTGVVCVASPYVARPTRRIGALLVGSLVFASMYLGTGYPNDALAAIVLGWGVAAAVHLVFRSPGGRPTAAQVAAALDELGVDAVDVRLAPVQPRGATLMVASGASGPLALRILGRDETDAHALAKLWRFVVYKDSGPDLYLDRRHDVEHEAYTMLLAQRAGVHVPDVVVAGKAGPDAAVLAVHAPVGLRLSEIVDTGVADATLDAVWSQAAALRRAGIAHGRLNAAAVVVADAGPVLTDFHLARSTSTTEQRDGDLVELLVSTAAIVGEERAVDAAVRGMGKEAVSGALPMMQSGVLTRATRHELSRKERSRRMKRLRELSATATGADVPTLEEVHRVSGSNLAMAIGTLVALTVLLGQVGSPQEMWDTIRNANWWLALLALVLSLSTNFAYAIALLGTVPIRLPLLTTAETELAMSFSNLAIPGIGGIALQIRYLQKQGVPLASAVAAGGFLTGVVNGVEQVALFGLALALSPASVHLGDIPTGSIVDLVLIVVLAAGVAAGLLFGVPRIRRRVLPPIGEGLRTLGSAMRSPRRLALLFAGNTLATVTYAFVLFTSIAAFGGHVSYWTVLALNIGIGTIAAMIPVPGGNTAVGTIGMTGALTAIGVSAEIAVAAVLLDEIVVSYLPAVAGWFATRHLMEHDEI
jgi:undecaprenyl-diphosphatase